MFSTGWNQDLNSIIVRSWEIWEPIKPLDISFLAHTMSWKRVGVNAEGQGKISNINNNDSAYPLRIVVSVLYKILNNIKHWVFQRWQTTFPILLILHSISINQNCSMKKYVIKLRKVKFYTTDWHIHSDLSSSKIIIVFFLPFWATSLHVYTSVVAWRKTLLTKIFRTCSPSFVICYPGSSML